MLIPELTYFRSDIRSAADLKSIEETLCEQLAAVIPGAWLKFTWVGWDEQGYFNINFKAAKHSDEIDESSCGIKLNKAELERFTVRDFYWYVRGQFAAVLLQQHR